MRKQLSMPKKLLPGGTVGIIAPAGLVQPEKFEAGIQWLKEQGYKVKVGNHVFARCGYLAGTDAERAADIMTMFLDETVDAICCARGGYGCMRLLPLLDYRQLRKHPKIFIGYSDITALHIALQQQAHFVTFHGPMVASSMGEQMD